MTHLNPGSAQSTEPPLFKLRVPDWNFTNLKTLKAWGGAGAQNVEPAAAWEIHRLAFMTRSPHQSGEHRHAWIRALFERAQHCQNREPELLAQVEAFCLEAFEIAARDPRMDRAHEWVPFRLMAGRGEVWARRWIERIASAGALGEEDCEGRGPLGAMLCELPDRVPQAASERSHVLRALLDAGASLDGPPGARPPLWEACLEARADVVRELLAAGADPRIRFADTEAPWGETQMSLSEHLGHYRMLDHAEGTGMERALALCVSQIESAILSGATRVIIAPSLAPSLARAL